LPASYSFRLYFFLFFFLFFFHCFCIPSSYIYSYCLCLFLLYFYFFLSFLLFCLLSVPFTYFFFSSFLVDKRVWLVFWQYSLRICDSTVFTSYFCDLDGYTNGIKVSYFTTATAVSPVYALRWFIQDLQIHKACLNWNLDKVYIAWSQSTNCATVAFEKTTGNITGRYTFQCEFISGA
jgi:hypothetical protein